MLKNLVSNKGYKSLKYALVTLMLLTIFYSSIQHSNFCSIHHNIADLNTTNSNQTMNKTLPGMSFLIYTLITKNDGDGYDFIRIISNRNRYAENHNNIESQLRARVQKGVRERVWQKLRDVLKSMEKYDWIWVLDGNAFIMNGNISLEELVHRSIELPIKDGVGPTSSNTTDIIVAKDCNTFNMGSFLMRSSSWTKLFIEEWLRLEYDEFFPRHKENTALQYLWEKNVLGVKDHLNVVPMTWINSYSFKHCGPEYVSGFFVLHSEGEGVEQLMKTLLL